VQPAAEITAGFSLTLTPKLVRKRDGSTTQSFELQKIENAVRKAWIEAEGSVDEAEIRRVSMMVANAFSDEEANVEKIQDAVETALMKQGRFAVAKSYILYRQKRAEARKARRALDPAAIADYIHASKYARYEPELMRREVYDETVARVEMMHQRKFEHVPGMRQEISRAFDLVRDKRLLPSMRSMQFGGRAIEVNNNRIYNCSFTLIDRMAAFSQGMYLLLCGCGVGYSVQYDHVDKLPALKYIDDKKVQHHVVADTIEGWADALAALLDGYVRGHHIEFSYHLIRAAGTPLKVSGGKAPGHMRLKKSLEAIRAVLHGAQGRKLRPIECHRIMCHAADAVLSGGIRRSAMIALFSLEDSEMMYAKTGDWWKDDKEPYFANANNSVALKRDEVKEKQFKRIFQMTKEFGEPGFVFIEETHYGTNPCVPAGTRVLTREGYRSIETMIDQPTVVWNGIQWRTVTPKVTGTNQPLVRVHLSDGTHLDCTDYHEWCIAIGKWTSDKVEERVRAIDLQEGDALVRYDMPVVEAGEDMPNAYAHGFWCADGVLEDADRKATQLYGVKQSLIDRLNPVRVSTYNEKLDRTRVVLPSDMPDKFVVPMSASVKSRLEWLAGVFDGDGTVVRNPNSCGVQLASINRAFLLEVRLLLTTLGVQAKVGAMNDGGMRSMPNGRGGHAEYLTQSSYRLLINATDTHKLVRLGLRTSRLDLSLAEQQPQRDARRFVTVVAVERLAMASTVYCFTEESNHTGTFEGIVTGQCAEIGLNPRLDIDDDVISLMLKKGMDLTDFKGQSLTGWAFCNLCEINAAKLTSFEDFVEVARAATLIGTLQATYTSFPYLGWVSEAIAEREALLGIGMTGMMDAPQVSCNPEYQRAIAGRITEWNADFAERLGVRPAARTTCVKPSGTTSLELGSVGSGHHAHHARRYIRRVTADEYETVFQAFKDKNPHMCVRKPDGKWIIEFPVQAPNGAVLKKDLSALTFLDMVRSTQTNWVMPGTANPGASPGLSHNVSNTITVGPDEWEDVANYLWEHRDSFTGVSLLSDTGDTDYTFAPFEAVRTEAQERRFNELVANYQPVDYMTVYEAEDGTNLSGEAACANGACERT